MLLGANTRVLGDARLRNCLIGRNCVIEAGAELEDAVLWDNVYLKPGARIHGAVLCHNTRIGQGVVIEEGAVIADETTIGDEAYVKRDVKIWPRKVVEGGAIVTTNLKASVDEAFLRRFRFAVDFPFPDAGLRARIWAGVFPPETPTEGLDFGLLSRLTLAGGHIRSIALSAAFLAAAEGGPVTMAHVAQAARGEIGKLGRPLPEGQLRALG